MQYISFELAEELEISEVTMQVLNHVRASTLSVYPRVHMPSAENEVYQEQMTYIMYQAKREMQVHRQLTEEQQLLISNTYFGALAKYQREFAYTASRELPYVLASAAIRSMKYSALGGTDND